MKLNDKIVISFDLDFTLIDNREGIINSFNYALQKYNIPQIEKAEIEKMIGTPLNEMFAQVSDLNPSPLCIAFREYYVSKGMFQVTLFPGVKNLLNELTTWSTLGVITSKKEKIAVKLLKYLKMDRYFAFILGETDQRKSKMDSKLIQFLQKKFKGYKFVIIGDHPNDKKLAEQLECPFIGVLTGNHSAKDLKFNNENVKILILNNVTEINRKLINSLF